jgi:hypothetical protein
VKPEENHQHKKIRKEKSKERGVDVEVRDSAIHFPFIFDLLPSLVLDC